MDSQKTTLREQFISQIANADAAIKLFNYLEDVYFFIKDREGRFIAANPLQVEKLGCGQEGDVVGKVDSDFFPSSMVDRFLKDDRAVMESGQAIEKQIELVSNPDGSVNWQITSKVPVLSSAGLVIGVMGIMRDLDQSADQWQPYHQMKPVIDFIGDHYSQTISVEVLAEQVDLSVSQFEKRFRSAFNATPVQFIIRYRVTRACHDLVSSDKKIIDISINNGFYDHSHFSREFKRLIGLSPGQYRKRHTQ